MKKSQLFLFLLLLVCTQTLSAQTMRRSFILGSNEEQYDQLRTDYARTMLTVCNENPEEALKHWFKLLQSVEQYADKIDFDLNGAKLYINVFWEAEGGIAHIGILPMPDSKNIKHENLVAFFSSFIRQYVPSGELKSDRKFSHYTTVSFPTFSKKSNG